MGLNGLGLLFGLFAFEEEALEDEDREGDIIWLLLFKVFRVGGDTVEEVVEEFPPGTLKRNQKFLTSIFRQISNLISM